MQNTLEKNNFATYIIFGCLNLIVCDLHFDQLIVIFYTTIFILYSTMVWVKNVAIINEFEKTQAKVKIKVMSKKKIYF